MKIKILGSIASREAIFNIGETVEVSEETAAVLIDCGAAESAEAKPLPKDPKEKIEK